SATRLASAPRIWTSTRRPRLIARSRSRPAVPGSGTRRDCPPCASRTTRFPLAERVRRTLVRTRPSRGHAPETETAGRRAPDARAYRRDRARAAREPRARRAQHAPPRGGARDGADVALPARAQQGRPADRHGREGPRGTGLRAPGARHLDGPAGGVDALAARPPPSVPSGRVDPAAARPLRS